MKNFSAKNAEFETLKINNEAAITSANLGTDPNKIPLNKDLGSLAYQDAVNLDDVSADMLELRAIAAEISDSAVDVFVYDTSRDSDGGAWRKRTQHTSWYHEELNTATRGARREFPAVAVIVAEGGATTIYDGDDPTLPMWMVFANTNTSYATGSMFHLDADTDSIFALNGQLIGGSNNASQRGGEIVNFLKDTGYKFNHSAAGGGFYRGTIAERAASKGWTGTGEILIVNGVINDVAMTILPNAPIDENTGLPVPTIAVATNGGVSVIKDDGTVVDITCGNINFTSSYYVIFDQLNRLFFSLDAQGNSRRMWGLNDIPATDLVVTTDINEKQNADIFIADDNSYGTATKDMFLFNQSNPQTTGLTPDSSIGTNKGLFKAFINREDSSKSLHNYTTSKYNTGWMPGDIKLATLSDTTVENIGVNSDELVKNGGFLADSDWTKGTGWTISGEVASKAISADSSNLTQEIDCVIGQTYVVSWDTTSIDASAVGFYTQSGGSITAVQNYYESVGSYSETFTATSESVIIALRAGSTAVLSIDNISIRATTELITNGDFSNGTTGWGEISDATLTTIGEGVNLKVSSGDNQAGFFQNLNANNTNQRYILSFEASDFTGDSAANLMLSINDYKEEGSAITGNFEMLSTKEDGFYSVSFNGRSGGVMVFFRIYDVTGTCSVDTHMNIKNISVRPAVEDRSVNNNGLQVIGEINKTPVAPGADLVAYSGFSANNYLVQPYNEDLDFGTGDFCVMGWFNANSSGAIIYSRRPQSSNINALEIGINTDATLYVYTIEDNRVNSSGTPITGKPITLNVWNNFCAVRSGETINLYVNGVLHSSITSTIRDLTNASAELCLGIYGDQSTLAFDGEISLIRASTTAPTAAQIAKIYRDEKALFQDGAQATLYGTSDSVTALAYDDSEQLLHVGTASGRSDFRGLARVNNTTTAISNSISAAEGTIIQN